MDKIRFEYPDPKPVEVPVNTGRFPNTLAELEAQARLRQFLQVQAIPETFEESDDFNVTDDPPDYERTPWEIAADASTLTPEQLFQEVYGITREEAHARLDQLARKGKGEPITDKPSPNSGDATTN